MNAREVVAMLFTAEQSARIEEIQTRLQEIERNGQQLEAARDLASGSQRGAIKAQAAELLREAKALQAEGELLVARRKVVDQVNEALPMAEIAGEILTALPEIAKGPVHTVVSGFLTVLEDLDAESGRFAKLRARGHRNFLTALTANGFTREEAMEIILASIGQAQTNARRMMDASKTAASRK